MLPVVASAEALCPTQHVWDERSLPIIGNLRRSSGPWSGSASKNKSKSVPLAFDTLGMQSCYFGILSRPMTNGLTISPCALLASGPRFGMVPRGWEIRRGGCAPRTSTRRAEPMEEGGWTAVRTKVAAKWARALNRHYLHGAECPLSRQCRLSAIGRLILGPEVDRSGYRAPLTTQISSDGRN